jgi:hypothetical protein
MRRSAVVLIGLFMVSGPLRAADDPKATIEKAIKAHGGEENLSKYKASQAKGKGTISIMGMDIDFTFESSVQVPNKVRTDLKLDVMGNKVLVSRGYDGKTAWSSEAGMLRELEGDQLADVKDEVFGNYIESLVPLLKDAQFKLESAGETKVEDKPAVGVKVSAKGHKDVTLFFDKESGMIVMVKSKSKDITMKEVDSEAFPRDYKDVNGVKTSMKVMIKHDGKKFLEIEQTEAKNSEKLDDKIFTKPE